MKTTMDMSSYEIEQDTMGIKSDEEIINSGWSPDVELACEQRHVAPTDEHVLMSMDLTTLDSEDDISAAYRLYVFQNFLR